MIVYVVNIGDYECRHIEGIFTDRRRAEIFAASIGERVDEVETDSEWNDAAERGLRPYFIAIHLTGIISELCYTDTLSTFNLSEVRVVPHLITYWPGNTDMNRSEIRVWCWAKSDDDAKAISVNKLTEFFAANPEHKPKENT